MKNFKKHTRKPYKEYKNENLDKIIKILKDKNSFYYDERINIEIIDNIENAAKGFERKITRTSVRNIYNAFKDIEMQLNQKYINKIDIDTFSEDQSVEGLKVTMDNQKEEVFGEIKPIIKLMKGKIHYLISRKIEGLNKNKKLEINAYNHLENFFKQSISVINKFEEFEAFLKVFECMYGYLEKGSEN